VERLASLIELEQQLLPRRALSLATGCATAQKGDRLETTVSQADERMLTAKREYYARRRRRPPGHAGRRADLRPHARTRSALLAA